KLCRKFGKWSFRPSPYRYSTRRFLPSTQLSFCNLSRNLSTGGSGKLAIRPTRFGAWVCCANAKLSHVEKARRVPSISITLSFRKTESIAESTFETNDRLALFKRRLEATCLIND